MNEQCSLRNLTDAELLAETRRAAGVERDTTSQLVALLAEVDERRLFLGQGYSSMFTYCTQALLLSEHAAYARIAAARLCRRFPEVLGLVRDGSVTLTNLVLLAPHLTPENCNVVLAAATRKSKAELERLIATIAPHPDIAATIRRLPQQSPKYFDISPHSAPQDPSPRVAATSGTPACIHSSPQLARPALVAPLSADRFLLRVTLSAESRAKLQRAQDLMRHSCPTGDAAVVIDRALSLLVEHLEKARQGSPPRRRSSRTTSPSRHIPAAVKHAVWTRDTGRCAFVGADGRCSATGFLEFHHVVPYSAGGPSDARNLQLRCRAHNAYEAERDFGERARHFEPAARA